MSQITKLSGSRSGSVLKDMISASKLKSGGSRSGSVLSGQFNLLTSPNDKAFLSGEDQSVSKKKNTQYFRDALDIQEEQLKKKEELDMEGCTFQPILTSRQVAKRPDIPIHERLAQKGEEVKKHIEEIKE